MLRSTRRPILIASLATALGGLLMALPDLALPGSASFWNGLFTDPHTLFYFCEPPHLDAFIRQPADTFSNLGFLWVGVWILVQGIRDRSDGGGASFVSAHPAWSFLYAAALIFTFLGSAFFHASLTWAGEWTDLAAVFAAAWLPVAFNAHAIHAHSQTRPGPARPWVLLFGLVLALSCFSIFRVDAWITFPAALLAIAGSAVWLYRLKRRENALLPGAARWLAGSGAVTLIAVMWFVFDIRRVLCDPDSLFQPHALWHLGDAAAAGVYYGFMRRVRG